MKAEAALEKKIQKQFLLTVADNVDIYVVIYKIIFYFFNVIFQLEHLKLPRAETRHRLFGGAHPRTLLRKALSPCYHPPPSLTLGREVQ